MATSVSLDVKVVTVPIYQRWFRSWENGGCSVMKKHCKPVSACICEGEEEYFGCWWEFLSEIYCIGLSLLLGKSVCGVIMD